MYYVWKRSDGNIGVSCFMPENFKSGSGESFTFEKLKETSDWNEASRFMKIKLNEANK